MLLISCTGSNSDLRAWMDSETRNMRAEVPPLPTIQSFQTVEYTAASGLDPFSPSRLVPTAQVQIDENAPDKQRRKEELEHFDLASMYLVGLLRKEDKANEAYGVVSIEGRFYRVGAGSRLGKDFGVVTGVETSDRMGEGRLLIEERVQDATGKWEKRNVTLELQALGEVG